MKKSVLIVFTLIFSMSTFMTSCSDKNAPEVTQGHPKGHLIRFYSDGLKLKEIRVKEGNKIKIVRDNKEITYTPPGKQGYEFLGWLSNGKIFDFNTEVDTSITLVASWREKVYTVSFFETLEGKKLNEIKVKYKEIINQKNIQNPSISHYEFLGWLSSNEKAFDFSIPILENTNVYANWIKKHQVTALLYLEGPTMTTFSVRDGGFLKNIFSNSNDKKREGYEFVRWETSSGEFNPDQPIKKDFVIYGKWLKFFTVQFKTDGGIPPVPKKTIAKGLHIQKPKALTKKGFSFERWVDGNGLSFIFDTPIVSDITLKAVWKQNDKDKVSFNLTYDYNYKNAPSVRVVSFLEKELVKESSFPPQREGYKFVGWRHNGQAFIFGRPITKNIRLEADWILSKTKKYTVTYDHNYTGAPIPNVVEIPEGESIIKSPFSPQRDDYKFVEWRHNGQAFTFGRPITENIRLEADWILNKTKKHTVTYDHNYTGAPTPNIVEIPERDSIKRPSNPTRDSYLFLEWRHNGQAFTFGQTITENIRLEAAWILNGTKEHTVIYDQNYTGAPAPNVVKIPKGSSVNEPSNPIRNDYRFVGWRYRGQPFIFGNSITENIRLEAAWSIIKIKKYRLTYNQNYTGAPAPNIVMIPERNSINKLLPNPTREGYRFVEWQYNGQAFTFGRPIMTDIILMAFWEVDEVVPTVTFITGNGGSAVTPAHPDDTGKVSPPKSNPEKENYIFIKWQKADKDFDFENTIVDKDIALTAVWMEKKKYEEVKDIVEPTKYQNERELGAPSRPTWIDAFRHYPELDFYKKGRYLLVWRKDPGDTAKPASRWEVQMITFKNPAEIRDKKFGKVIDPFDVKETKVIYTEDNPKLYTADETVTLPGDLLPPDKYSTDSSVNYGARLISLATSSQLAYIGITRKLTNGANRHAVVAYKVRAYAKTKKTDDFGQDIEVEVYNDSPVIMVNYAQGKSVQITSTGGGGSGNGGGSIIKKAIPDELTSRADVNAKLKLSAGKHFVSSWENRKLTGETPIEKLITKEDYKALFPSLAEKTANAHDKDMKYYSWENLVEASRYFPKFLNEGSLEDKYRELAAFFGNKSHETGDGWVAMGVNRWKCGLWWIVELSVLAGRDKTDPNYLYNAYSATYTSPGHATYPPVEGKSYHGRGPVQLSWNYNYGRMSQQLFEDKDILLSNPNLLAREGLYGWASAIWFWMEPQDNKPSGHDVMVGNLRLSTPYTVPTSRTNRTARTHLSTSTGSDAAGNTVSYKDYRVPAGAEIGFGMTINIINGGLEANTGSIDNRQARRIGYYARYLDYFGTVKTKIGGPISPEVSNGDSVPTSTIEAMKGWRNWIYLPADGVDPNGLKDFPKDDIPSILSSTWQSSF